VTGLIKKFRKKPVEIEAWQWNGLCVGENIEDVRVFLEQWGCWAVIDEEYHRSSSWQNGYVGYEIYIETLEGRMHVSKGDWIIKGVVNEFYPCKHSVFAITYEEIT
jgi:hypothetical protein